MAPPSSPNAAPSPADAQQPHPTLMAVAQALAFFHRAGKKVEELPFYTWAVTLWDTDKYDRAFEGVQKHMGKQTTVEADLEAAHDLLTAAIKSAETFTDERITEDEYDEFKKVYVAYKARRQKREEDSRTATSGS